MYYWRIVLKHRGSGTHYADTQNYLALVIQFPITIDKQGSAVNHKSQRSTFLEIPQDSHTDTHKQLDITFTTLWITITQRPARIINTARAFHVLLISFFFFLSLFFSSDFFLFLSKSKPFFTAENQVLLICREESMMNCGRASFFHYELSDENFFTYFSLFERLYLLQLTAKNLE